MDDLGHTLDQDQHVLARRKLDADAFARLFEAGILDESERVELIDGELIQMAPIGTTHSASVGALNWRLIDAFGRAGQLWVQTSLVLDPLNVPEPDFVVLLPRADEYFRPPRPGPADVMLVIEVADSSLAYDQRVKLPLYARVGLPEYWVVDLRHKQLIAHRAPRDGSYAERTVHGPADRIRPMRAPDAAIPLDWLGLVVGDDAADD